MVLMVRIVSLLPAATEICCALGLRDALVGVSHECDFPESVVGLPVVTESSLPSADEHSSKAIDEAVRHQATEGLSLYRVDEQRLAALHPDLILTQDTCRVCAVDLSEVQRALRMVVGSAVDVVSLAPHTLDEVWLAMRQVGEVTSQPEAADALVQRLRTKLRALNPAASQARPRVLFLEWLDPPMPAGHWTPELLRQVGADSVLGHEGQRTTATTWSDIEHANIDFVVVAPCGFSEARTRRELSEGPAQLQALLAAKPHVVVDGNAYFNRPGPRLVEGAECVAEALRRHYPESC